mgnify:CR=1 FL=1
MDELKQGSNPLNDLEVDPNNPSERWAILINYDDTKYGDDDDDDNLTYYHLLKRNGFDDEHIILFLEKHDDASIPSRLLSPFFEWDFIRDVGKDLFKDYKVEVDYLNDEVNKENVLACLRNLASDENDIVLISVSAHGSKEGYFAIDPHTGYAEDTDLYGREFNEAIGQIKYGRLIYVQGSCHAEGFIRDIANGPYQLDNLLALGETSIGEPGGGAYFAPILFSLLNYKPLFEAYEWSLEYVRRGHLNHPVLYYYGQDDSWIYWFNPIVYLPKKKE